MQLKSVNFFSNIFVDNIVGHSEKFMVLSLDFYKGLKVSFVCLSILPLNLYNLKVKVKV